MRYIFTFFLLEICFYILFQLLLKTCLLPNFGKNRTHRKKIAYNDIGNTLITIFNKDLEYLGDWKNYNR